MSALDDLKTALKAAFTREITETNQEDAINNLSTDIANAIAPYVASGSISKDVNNLTYYYTKTQSDARYRMKKFQIPSDGITDDNTGIISGTSTFNLPTDFDPASANFVQDGSMLAQYTINTGVTPKTITFNLVPLANTCFLFYYSL